MDYLPEGIHSALALPEALNFQVLPVMPSVFNGIEPLDWTTEYLFGLVKLWRRIAAKITSTPSLNCVLVIATR